MSLAGERLSEMPEAVLPMERLAIHQVTLMQCDFRASIECFARHEVRQTAVWLDKLDAIGTEDGARVLEDNAMSVNALCPGGLVSGAHAPDMDAALEMNRRWLDQAAEIGAASLVVITGGLPEGETDLFAVRERALEGFHRLIEPARASGVRLAFEPLHPMVCGGRSVISRVADALDFLDALNTDDVFGLAVDSYAVWWDLDLAASLRRAGPRLLHFHVSDWLRDTEDVRFDRGMPGDGVIDNRRLREWMEDAGFRGPVEVEIFSEKNWWRRDPDDVVRTILDRRAEFL